MAHWGAQKEVQPVDYDPVDPEEVLDWTEVHEEEVLWAIPLPHRLLLPVHPEEPYYRKVSAHLSK